MPGAAPDRPGDRGPSRAADRLGHGLRLRRRAPGLQLVAGAGHYSAPQGNSAWQILLVVVGFLITIVALTPGARFWFDLLGKLGTLRSTGPKPASSSS